MEKSVLINLDNKQKEISELGPGYFKVIAGAGSGKSTVLLHRAAKLSGSGKILCVTFTSEAAKSLRTRCGKMFPHVDTSIFSTLHSLALKFAYEYADSFPFPLADNPLAEEGVTAKAAFDAIENKINYRAFTNYVSLQKRKRISPAEAIRLAESDGNKLDYAIAYKRYQQSLKKLGVLDFDDLISNMVNVLECRPDIRANNQYDYVMQDEAQDACEIDWRLLQLITEKHKSLTCVGDAGQAVFSFRGGVSEHLLNMEKMFPGTKTFVLGNNYRSTQAIVTFGKGAYPFPEISENFEAVSTDKGIEPTITGYSTDYREAEEVVRKISSLNPEECVILARTNLALRVFEEALLDAGIKYYLLGDSGFWETSEIQNVLCYLRAAVMLSDNGIIGAIRTPFWPSRYIKKKSVIDEIRKWIDTYGDSAWKALDKIHGVSGFKDFLRGLFKYQYVPAKDAVEGIIKDLRAFDYYRDEANISPDRNPVENLKELIRVAGRYPDLKTFLDFVRRISGYNKTKKGVGLSTIHSFKGKEAKHVFVVNCSEGMMPHRNSDNLEEEKNIFFVAVSRPQLTLDISFNGSPSPFLGKFIKENYGSAENEDTEAR